MTSPHHWFVASLPHGKIPSELYPNQPLFIVPNSNMDSLWKGAVQVVFTQMSLKCSINRLKNTSKTYQVLVWAKNRV